MVIKNIANSVMPCNTKYRKDASGTKTISHCAGSIVWSSTIPRENSLSIFVCTLQNHYKCTISCSPNIHHSTKGLSLRIQCQCQSLLRVLCTKKRLIQITITHGECSLKRAVHMKTQCICYKETSTETYVVFSAHVASFGVHCEMYKSCYSCLWMNVIQTNNGSCSSSPCREHYQQQQHVLFSQIMSQMGSAHSRITHKFMINSGFYMYLIYTATLHVSFLLQIISVA